MKDKYWICSDCAKGKNWIAPTGAVTMILGRCGYCKRQEEVMLTPVVDFNRGKIEPVWD